MKRWTHSILMSAALLLAALPMSAQDAASISEQVRQQIVTQPFYTIFDNVQFEFRDGEAELTGEVFRPVLRGLIEKDVARVDGVDRVVNKLEILPLSSYDNQLRRALAKQIYRTQLFSRYAVQRVPSVHIIVKNGHVSLEGVVHNEGQKRFAGIMAHNVNGVFSVTNNLRTES